MSGGGAGIGKRLVENDHIDLRCMHQPFGGIAARIQLEHLTLARTPLVVVVEIQSAATCKHRVRLRQLGVSAHGTDAAAQPAIR